MTLRDVRAVSCEKLSGCNCSASSHCKRRLCSCGAPAKLSASIRMCSGAPGSAEMNRVRSSGRPTSRSVLPSGGPPSIVDRQLGEAAAAEVRKLLAPGHAVVVAAAEGSCMIRIVAINDVQLLQSWAAAEPSTSAPRRGHRSSLASRTPVSSIRDEVSVGHSRWLSEREGQVTAWPDAKTVETQLCGELTCAGCLKMAGLREPLQEACIRAALPH